MVNFWRRQPASTTGIFPPVPAAPASPPYFPQIIGPSTLLGRLAAGAGPVEAIPLAVLQAILKANSTLVDGSVIFASGGLLGQDNAYFFWDATNHRLAIGTTHTTSARLIVSSQAGAIPVDTTNEVAHFVGVDSVTGRLVFDVHSATAGDSAVFTARRARGTAASPTAAQSGDTLGAFSARGYGATGWIASSSAQLKAVAAEAFTDAHGGADLVLAMVLAGGLTLTDRARFYNDGGVIIGNAPAAGASPGAGILQVDTGLIAGINGTGGGSLKLKGATSGDATIKVAAVAGTATNFQLPATNGSNGNVLQTDGSGNTSWASANTQAMVWLETITANNSSGALATTVAWTNAYKAFLLVFNELIPATNGAAALVQVHASTYKTTGYLNSGIFSGGNGAPSALGGPLTSGIQLTGPNATDTSNGIANATAGLNGHVKIMNPSGSGIHLARGEIGYQRATAGSVAIVDVCGTWNTAGAIDGAQCITNTGNWLSGFIEVYGII